MKTVISKRIASLMPVNEEIKINNISYLSGINFHYGMKLSETDKDYTLNIDAIEFNYFCYNKNNKITCWPVAKGDQQLNDEGQWKKEGRQEIKPGKFLLLFTDHFNIRNAETFEVIEDNELRNKIIRRTCEVFADKIRGSNQELSFDITSDIEKIYNTLAHDNSGYLLNSCMRKGSGYGCQPFSGFYNHVPELQIVYKKIGDSLLFRALLWSCVDYDGNEVKFLDRIYASEQVNLQLIDKAKENNWAYRFFSDCTPRLNDKPVKLSCEISRSAFNYLENEGSPYVDTLNYLTESDGKFILSNYKRSDYTLTCCEGNAVNNSCVCCSCGERVGEDDARYNNNGDCYCEDCFYEHYFCCERCGEAYNNDEIVNLSSGCYCEDCAHAKGYYQCTDCGEWTNDGMCVDGESYCERCFCDKFAYCERCEEDKPIDDCNNITVDGQEVCICDECKDELNHCANCDNYFTDPLNDDDLCPDCAEEKEKEEAEKLQLELNV